MRVATKIFIGGVIFFVGGYFGYQAYAAYSVDRVEFQPLKPGTVSLVGINTGRNFKITVSNDVAQLLQTSSDEAFQQNEKQDETVNDESQDSGNKKRVPIKDMLASLQGDEVALGKLVTAMNDPLRTADLPTTEVLWKAPDLKKALDGDPLLAKKLEEDLNVHLDGSPLEQIRPSNLQNGIVIEAYVPLDVMIEGQKKRMMAPIKTPFKARFVAAVAKRYENVFNPSKEAILGYYMQERDNLKQRPGDVEDVAARLKGLIDEKYLVNEYSDAPSRVLGSAFVVANDSLMTAAKKVDVLGANGKTIANVDLWFNDEGRKRLWQYSRRHPNTQLLFVRSDGVAIAAPRIRQELQDSQLTIKNVQNPSLAEETVNQIEGLVKK